MRDAFQLEIGRPGRVGMLPADDVAGQDFEQFAAEHVAIAEEEAIGVRAGGRGLGAGDKGEATKSGDRDKGLDGFLHKW